MPPISIACEPAPRGKATRDTVKSIVTRESARRDVENAVDYYARECGAQVAVSFVDAVQSTFGLIAKHPASGSLRYAYELGLPDLRSMTLKAFPYIVFYLEQGDYVDVWRILHAVHDTPAWPQDPEVPA
ncbi:MULTISPECIES: type II toxin-antitoxin system RelE/ParE family toxin [Rhizobium]|uniref:Type II toxin-antitoxin system RelE/ParE family toxin n=1 Tax=Rhizobium phaseoli TaxID=396 RepID=A0A7X6IY92_9HYPH|nr:MULTISPECIES: type II toxin-antitoxin system RelE/ParE family toxin [Rhizobium]MDE8757596.1 type II toxin-antitoxin system RelE/ParE family toxin [Rhizobium sp. CBK13]NKF11359.1 type II toxin-antitoxin system RelE/ParE family toxin [Rhizobium phaseoli]QPK12605.1 type II toxin-antitoxin system RelE/ParE family toxin [Rhizobium phaseoli]